MEGCHVDIIDTQIVNPANPTLSVFRVNAFLQLHTGKDYPGSGLLPICSYRVP